uniref:Uncharacterized protein LOC114330821 n=1 Tax=Diabrotica virgifera virgifera TaxID=50390 RepID=A0A6P7FIW4_DIAVI
MENNRSQRRRKYGAKRYNKLTDAEKMTKYDLSTITDEQIDDIVNSNLDSDDEIVYEDDDDSIADPDYVLTAEKDEIIFSCLRENIIDLELSTNLPLELSNITDVSEGLVGVSEPHANIFTSEMATLTLPELIISENTSPEVPTTDLDTQMDVSVSPVPLASKEPFASTSTQLATTTKFKPKKRPRSPLPTVEATGPQTVPSAGGLHWHRHANQTRKVTMQY